MKIVTVVGARPQFIKAAAVSRAIARHNESAGDDSARIREVIVHTGQHFDENMSEVFFREMEIPPPDYRLEINSLSHGAMTGRMLEKIEGVLLKEEPDYLMVYGDTNSTIAGALAAKKLHIRVIHVEAGLRSFNMRMPEEINRILTDRISDILCCPTDAAVNNLRNEGFTTVLNADQTDSVTAPGQATGNIKALVIKTGDVMQDAALFYSTFSAERSTIIKDLGLDKDSFVLCTIHRAENTDNLKRLKNIFEALAEVGKDLQVVLPLHPRTQKILTKLKLDLPPINDATSMIDKIYTTGNLHMKIISPVGYFDMIELLRNSRMVMTDSGGLQKEAYFFGRPCVTLRDETEWVELVESGTNILAGADRDRIMASYRTIKSRNVDCTTDLYGNGSAGSLLVKFLALQTQAH
jgi:UDP-GlcNAc3NAcA epimerase